MMVVVNENIVAIDFHTHVLSSVDATAGEEATEHDEAMAKYFKTDMARPTVHDLADYYRALKMMCVAFTVDSSWATGEIPEVSNNELFDLADEHPDVIIPFASVDPHGGRREAREVQRLADRGAQGFKFHPSSQAFYPNDPDVYPIYEAIEESGTIALFHSGHTGAGAGRPGGVGIRLKYANPMHVDDIAVDFPEMRIVLAHPSFPWQDEALSVALHKPYVYIDLSGWSPKYFPPNLVQHARTLLKHKMLFGTDYPVITPERWMRDFEKLGFNEDVTKLIMRDNAAKLLEAGTG